MVVIYHQVLRTGIGKKKGGGGELLKRAFIICHRSIYIHCVVKVFYFWFYFYLAG